MMRKPKSVCDEIGTEEFYDLYDEARHRTRQDVLREYGTIRHAMNDPFTDDWEYQCLHDRLTELMKILDVMNADRNEREYKKRNFDRWD